MDAVGEWVRVGGYVEGYLNRFAERPGKASRHGYDGMGSLARVSMAAGASRAGQEVEQAGCIWKQGRRVGDGWAFLKIWQDPDVPNSVRALGAGPNREAYPIAGFGSAAGHEHQNRPNRRLNPIVDFGSAAGHSCGSGSG